MTSMAGSTVTAKLRGRDTTAGKRLIEMTGSAGSALTSPCAGEQLVGRAASAVAQTRREMLPSSAILSHAKSTSKKCGNPDWTCGYEAQPWSPEGRGTTMLGVYLWSRFWSPRTGAVCGRILLASQRRFGVSCNKLQASRCWVPVYVRVRMLPRQFPSCSSLAIPRMAIAHLRTKAVPGAPVLALVLMASVSGSAAFGDDAPSKPADATVDYASQVKPILTRHCVSCHGAVKPRGGLRLDTAAAALQGGKSGPVGAPGPAARRARSSSPCGAKGRPSACP